VGREYPLAVVGRCTGSARPTSDARPPGIAARYQTFATRQKRGRLFVVELARGSGKFRSSRTVGTARIPSYCAVGSASVCRSIWLQIALCRIGERK
jgi:hypothetical protein